MEKTYTLEEAIREKARYESAWESVCSQVNAADVKSFLAYLELAKLRILCDDQAKVISALKEAQRQLLKCFEGERKITTPTEIFTVYDGEQFMIKGDKILIVLGHPKRK